MKGFRLLTSDCTNLADLAVEWQGKNGLKVDPSLKCWIGNLPEGTQWKALQEHMNQATAAGESTFQMAQMEIFGGYDRLCKDHEIKIMK